jgi:ATP-dependent DNA ligase
MLDAAGKPVFSLLKDGSTHVHFYVFDLLMMSGKDVTGERWKDARLSGSISSWVK